jgi:hypothetical protein
MFSIQPMRHLSTLIFLHISDASTISPEYDPIGRSTEKDLSSLRRGNIHHATDEIGSLKI